MTLPASGAIELDQMHVEAGGSTSTEASINDTDILSLISKVASTEMSFSEWYGVTGPYSPNNSAYVLTLNSSVVGPTGDLIDGFYFHPTVDNAWWTVAGRATGAGAQTKVTTLSLKSTTDVTGRQRTVNTYGVPIAFDGDYILMSNDDQSMNSYDVSSSALHKWTKAPFYDMLNSDAWGPAQSQSDSTIGKDWDRGTKEMSASVAGKFLTGWSSIATTDAYCVGIDSALSSINASYSKNLPVGYRGIYAPYSSTHVQLCAFNDSGLSYNVLIEKVYGTSTSQVKASVGDGFLRCFRTNLGAWLFISTGNFGQANAGGYIGIRNSAGTVVGGNGDDGNYRNPSPSGLITEDGRIIVYNQSGGTSNIGSPPTVACYTASASPSVDWCRQFELLKRTSGGEYVSSGLMPTSMQNIDSSNVALNFSNTVSTTAYTDGYVAMCEVNTGTAPVAGTYGDIRVTNATLSYGARTGNIASGFIGSTAAANRTFTFDTAKLGTAKPAANSDSIFTAEVPSLSALSTAGLAIGSGWSTSTIASSSGW